jgi:hypothetical protein
MTEPVLDWLLAGDPSIRWQALDALTSAGPDEVVAARAAVARTGWGARLLAEQDDDGRWAGGLYSPKWTSTTYTLLLLERLGLPSENPQARRGCGVLWDAASRWDGGLTLAVTLRQPEVCITGILVQLAARFGSLDDDRVHDAVQFLRATQLGDGGWNCQSIRTGSQHGSFHTSIIVLEALTAYAAAGGSVAVADPLARGREFFLAHRLYRSHRTGEVVDRAFTRFPFPPQWHFDVLRGLEHFALVGAPADSRLEDAVAVVRAARRTDGTWPVHRGHAGREWFRMEERGPSRWATLRALRVLRWWETAPAPVASRATTGTDRRHGTGRCDGHRTP